MSAELAARIKSAIREVPDFPKPGILYYDITTVLSPGGLFSEIIDHLTERFSSQHIDAIVGIEARGFIFGAALAHSLRVPFIPVRKPGKLPYQTEEASYELEYGVDTLEIHIDALSVGHNALIIDDLLATGGTASSTVELVERLGAKVIECAFIVELVGLGGRDKIGATPCSSLVSYNLG